MQRVRYTEPLQGDRQLTSNKNTPQLRFSEFTDDWQEKKLGDIVQFLKGKDISKTDITNHGKTPCIRYGEIYTIYSECIRDIYSRTNLPTTDLILSTVEDVIIPSSGEDRLDIAKACCITTEGVALGSDINILRHANNGVFLAYYLNNAKKKEIASYAQGISIIHLYSSQLKLLSIKLPSLPEQQKIANFLSSVDTKLEQLNKKKELLEQYKKGCMQKIFSQEIRFQDSNGDNFPNWQEKKLGDIANIIMGQSPSSKNYNNQSVGLPLIQGNADLKNRKTIIRFWTSQMTKKCLKGDLILSVRAPVGSVGIADFDACIGRGVCCLKALNCERLFLFQFFIHFEGFWYKFGQGSTFDSINSNDLKNLKIPFPSLPEQQKIADFFSSIDTKLELVNKEIELAKSFKKGLLQRMFV